MSQIWPNKFYKVLNNTSYNKLIPDDTIRPPIAGLPEKCKNMKI